LRQKTSFGLKLGKGSHIVVPRLFEGDHAYVLQNDDRRVIFVYAYEGRYSLIGTTDVEFEGEPAPCSASVEEVRYLCRAANRYFARQMTEHDVAWSYCGIRPLFDDGSADPSAVTRDYMLRVDTGHDGAPVLSVFGGKITTYRRLAEQALAQLAPWLPDLPQGWTARVPLPGGDIAGGDIARFQSDLARRYPRLPSSLLAALAHRHGTLVTEVLGDARATADLGPHFGADLYAREVDYFIDREWARSLEDVLWRRTKTGLSLSQAQREAVARYLARRFSGSMAINPKS
jgi:glycerol-3-phosphate dehydrogenase